MKRFAIFFILLLATGLLFSQEIPMDALVGYWKLDDGAGSIVADSSGQNGNGELWGGADWCEGYMGGGLEFDGVDGYVDFGPGNGQFDLEEEVTLSIWVNQWDMGNGQDDPWFGKGDNAYMIKHQRGNFYEFFIYDTGWHSCEVPLDSSHMYTWHHFAGTFDGFEAKMYVDGEPADTLALESFINVTEHSLALAWNSQATSRYWQGQLDEAMIFSVALNDEQIKMLYDVKSDVMEARNVANAFRLQQNYPNPFNPVTTISYTIPATLPVTLEVYNTLGEQVATLVNEKQHIGTHSVTFDAADLPSGIYMYKLQAGDILFETKKMMLIK